jgi:hypothetical protein
LWPWRFILNIGGPSTFFPQHGLSFVALSHSFSTLVVVKKIWQL